MGNAPKPGHRKVRLPFFLAFMATYLAIDLASLAIDLTTGGHQQYGDYDIMAFIYIIFFFGQWVIGLGAWAAYRKLKNKWKMLYSAVMLLALNAVLMALIYSFDFNGHYILVRILSHIVLLTGAMTGPPCILSLLDSSVVLPCCASLTYTLVLLAALLLSSPAPNVSNTPTPHPAED